VVVEEPPRPPCLLVWTPQCVRYPQQGLRTTQRSSVARSQYKRRKTMKPPSRPSLKEINGWGELGPPMAASLLAFNLPALPMALINSNDLASRRKCGCPIRLLVMSNKQTHNTRWRWSTPCFGRAFRSGGITVFPTPGATINTVGTRGTMLPCNR
jgi:hypothetical protein